METAHTGDNDVRTIAKIHEGDASPTVWSDDILSSEMVAIQGRLMVDDRPDVAANEDVVVVPIELIRQALRQLDAKRDRF